MYLGLCGPGPPSSLYEWSKRPAPPACYRDLSMADSQVGFAVGEEGVIAKSTDAGSSWAMSYQAPADHYW